jgi:hypothetical protein
MTPTPQHPDNPDAILTLMENQTHVLDTPEGVRLTLSFCMDPFHYRVEWSEVPKDKKTRERVAKHYIAWRDQIFEEAAQAAKVCTMAVTPGMSSIGVPLITVYGKEFSKQHAANSAANRRK